MMKLEDACEENVMHVSTVHTPLPEVDEPRAEEDIQPSGIYALLPAQTQLQDDPFWQAIRLGLVIYAVRASGELGTENELLKVRNEILEANVVREYQGRTEAEKELRKIRATFALRESELADAVLALFRAYDKQENLEGTLASYLAQINAAEKILKQADADTIKLVTRIMIAEGDAEQKEGIIKMYEQRFGTREELYKLAAAEEKCSTAGKKCQTKYDCIPRLIQLHETGDCPRTNGQKIVDCVERFTDNAIGLMYAFYNAFLGRRKTK